MLNELFVVLSAAVLSMMPVSATPDVHVTYANVEKAVQAYTEKQHDYTIVVNCGEGEELTLRNATSSTLDCNITNTDLNTYHETRVSLTALNGELTINGVVVKSSSDSEQKG